MSISNDQKAEKAKIRFLKLADKFSKEEVTLAFNDQKCEMQVGERYFVFDLGTFEDCLKSGLINHTRNLVVLTRTGLAFLQRALNPEEKFVAQHAQINMKPIKLDGAVHFARTNESESPLSRLYYRKSKDGKSWLDENEFRAGERLRDDFEKAQLQPRISANWVASVASNGRGGNASADISNFALDARKRVEKAIAALGPDLSSVAIDICCFLKGLETIEREKLWPPRSAKLMLRTALRELVRHYGLANRNAKSSVSRHISHWGSEDFRPQL